VARRLVTLVMLSIWCVVGIFLISWLIPASKFDKKLTGPVPFDAKFEILVSWLVPAPKFDPKFTVAVPYKAAFEKLQKTDLEVINAAPQSSRDAAAQQEWQERIEVETQKLPGRIILHSMQKGDEVAADDLGPSVDLHNHHVLALLAASPLDGLRPTDEIDLYLVPKPSKSASTTPTTDAAEADAPQPLQEAETLVLTEILVLKIGEPAEDGSIPLLIAVPSNNNNLEVLSKSIGRSVANPVYVKPEDTTPSQ
jgi:hypothetical protein